jgi:multidrug efflux system membrane fusion protein
MSLPAKKIVIATVAALVVAGGGVMTALRTDAGAATKPAAAPAVDVDVASVIAGTITDWQSYSGRMEAVEHVDVRPLVPGTIVAVHFADGALVRKGDPLFTIDPRPYQAELERAQAQLAAAQARNAYTTSDFARAQRLIADNAIARRDYDEKDNAAREAVANVKAAQAAVRTAGINLGYTNVSAPVTGRVSRAELTVGNVVSNGTSAPLLTTLVSVSPIYASFDVDEQTYLRYLSHDARNTVPVSLGLGNESGYSREGVVAFIDNRLDTASGTIRVRARFDNADGVLVPGLYARIRVGGGAPHAALMVPDSAIGTDQDKKFVFVLDAQNHVQYREITPGAQQGSLRVVTKGLQASERIVVNGLQRARPGDLVKPNAVQVAGL